MDISKKQLAYKPKKVGELNGTSIMELSTKGGLHLIVKAQGSGFSTLGTGPHRAVARHIAEGKEPDIVWTELSKSDHLDYEVMAPLLPKYLELTEAFRKVEGSDDK